jgi:hypothetical protein
VFPDFGVIVRWLIGAISGVFAVSTIWIVWQVRRFIIYVVVGVYDSQSV